MKSLRISLFILSFLVSVNISAQNAFIGKWSGKLAIGESSLALVINLVQGDDGQLKCTLDSPDQGAYGIKAEASVEMFSGLKVTIPSIGATFKGMMIQESIVGTFAQMGNEFQLTLKKQSDILKRPQTPVAPFPYSQQEITFANSEAGATFAGTLTVPQGSSSSTPVVLLVSGSGQQNRDEEVFNHKPFAVIADFLARNGIATLRYDDRGVGASHGGEVKKATTLDFSGDAKAGIDYLKSTGKFDRIGVLGHSEGASIAFMIGASGDADFVISMAGIGVKGDAALTAQANRVLELQGSDLRLTVEMYRTNALSQNIPWIEWFLNYDPVPDIRKCQCPVFAANGEKDIQIIASLNLPSIKDNLSDNRHNLVREYPSLNHMFQHCTTGAVSEYGEIEETISPEFLQDIVKWINNSIK